MEAGNPNAKAALRLKIREALKKFSPEKRQSDSEKLRVRLKEQIFFKTAKSVLFFAPLPEEADLWPLLEEALVEKKIAALPCFDMDEQIYKTRRVKNLHVEILSGQFGIREPSGNCIEIPLDDLDLILVPGIAFDLTGHRLGRGKGFYDRLLQNFRGDKVGIAFDEQVVGKIPAQAHDVRMNFILTPTRCVEIQL